MIFFSNFRWIMEILSNQDFDAQNKEMIEQIDNLYYAPNLEQSFILILTRIPLWSNIMMDAFGSKNECATSSGLESYFKNFKNHTGTFRELNSNTYFDRLFLLNLYSCRFAKSSPSR